MRRVLVAGVVLIVLLAAGCAQKTFVRDTYRALSTMGTTYEVAMEGLKEARERGVLPEADRQMAILYGNMFHDAYHLAVDGLKLLNQGTDPDADVGALVVEASKGFGALMAIAGEYLEEVR